MNDLLTVGIVVFFLVVFFAAGLAERRYKEKQARWRRADYEDGSLK